MKDKSNKTAELPQITLNRYHKKIAVFSTIGGLLWTLYSLIDSVLLDIKDNEILLNIIKILVNLVVIGMILVCIFMMITYSTSYKLEREDELYKENVSRANKMFMNIIFFIGSLSVILSVIFDGKSITINYALISGIAWLIFACYNYFILYYDRPLNINDCEDYNYEIK